MFNEGVEANFAGNFAPTAENGLPAHLEGAREKKADRNASTERPDFGVGSEAGKGERRRKEASAAGASAPLSAALSIHEGAG